MSLNLFLISFSMVNVASGSWEITHFLEICSKWHIYGRVIFGGVFWKPKSYKLRLSWLSSVSVPQGKIWCLI